MKMTALYIRITSGVPVVLMGESGCGKSAVVSFLATFLGIRVFTLDVHGGLEEEDVVEFVSGAVANAYGPSRWKRVDLSGWGQYCQLCRSRPRACLWSLHAWHTSCQRISEYLQLAIHIAWRRSFMKPVVWSWTYLKPTHATHIHGLMFLSLLHWQIWSMPCIPCLNHSLHVLGILACWVGKRRKDTSMPSWSPWILMLMNQDLCEDSWLLWCWRVIGSCGSLMLFLSSTLQKRSSDVMTRAMILPAIYRLGKYVYVWSRDVWFDLSFLISSSLPFTSFTVFSYVSVQCWGCCLSEGCG